MPGGSLEKRVEAHRRGLADTAAASARTRRPVGELPQVQVLANGGGGVMGDDRRVAAESRRALSDSLSYTSAQVFNDTCDE